MQSYLETPVIGGTTSVTLTSAATLTSLGVTVSPLGSATVSTTDAGPVANFAITGGTQDDAAGGAVILHQGSGLELSDAAGVVDLQDFRVDTINNVINANVSVNGVAVGNVAVFSIGADAALTLTAAAASVVDETLGTTAITPAVQVGIAAVAPVLYSYASGEDGSFGSFLGGCDAAMMASQFLPFIGGQTVIDLTSAATLASLNVTVSPLGSASIDAVGDQAFASFDITGGTLDSASGAAVILHQGSGLELTDSAGTLSLSDFLVDTQNHVVDANVVVNGVSAGNLAVFNLGADGALTLTMTAADVVDATLGTQAITSSTVIGFAAPSPVALPASYADMASMIPADASGSHDMYLQNA